MLGASPAESADQPYEGRQPSRSRRAASETLEHGGGVTFAFDPVIDDRPAGPGVDDLAAVSVGFCPCIGRRRVEMAAAVECELILANGVGIPMPVALSPRAKRARCRTPR